MYAMFQSTWYVQKVLHGGDFRVAGVSIRVQHTVRNCVSPLLFTTHSAAVHRLIFYWRYVASTTNTQPGTKNKYENVISKNPAINDTHIRLRQQYFGKSFVTLVDFKERMSVVCAKHV